MDKNSARVLDVIFLHCIFLGTRMNACSSALSNLVPRVFHTLTLFTKGPGYEVGSNGRNILSPHSPTLLGVNVASV